MKTAVELYPDYEKEEQEKGYIYGPSNYQPILAEFGTIFVQVDDEDYQGDSRILYRDGSLFGWLQFGWGSCSGCDALQACVSMEEVQELIDQLHDSIKWFDSKEDAIEFFENHDWSGDYSWDSGEQKEFVRRVLDVLRTV